MNLEALGWCAQNEHHDESKMNIGRVIQATKEIFLVHNGKAVLQCELSGKLRFGLTSKSEIPVVGDWVEISKPFKGINNELCAIINEVFDRKSKISRMAAGDKGEQVLAANVDICFIVSSCNQEFNARRLERFISIANNGNTEPVLIVSKCDLVEDSSIFVDQISKNYSDLKIYATSVNKPESMEPLKGLLGVGKTFAFVGASGVGKSSLVNLLMGEEAQIVSDIREEDSKGRHTTTLSRMLFLEQGAILIDTPGLRELGMIGEEGAVEDSFPEIKLLLNNCRFHNCGHQNEPGCAILEAIESQQITAERFASYKKLQREILRVQNKLNKRENSNTKRKWKQINKDTRAKYKFKYKNQ